MKRVFALCAVVLLLSAPTVAMAQDARAMQASKVVQFALLLMAVDRNVQVDVNRDSAKQINTAMPEISPAVAENIVAHRATRGRFANLLDLLKVPGMDREVVTRNRHRIVL